jgi:hypothetical protein
MDLSTLLEIFGVTSSPSWISLPDNIILPGVGDPFVLAILFFIVGLTGPLWMSYFMIAFFRWVWWGLRLVVIPISIREWRRM